MVLTPWVLPRPVCCDRCPHTARPRENAPRYNLEQAVRTERNGYQHTHMPTHTHSLAHTFAHSLTRTHTYTHTHTLTSHPHSLKALSCCNSLENTVSVKIVSTQQVYIPASSILLLLLCSHGNILLCCFSLQAVMRCIIAYFLNKTKGVCWYYQ